MEQTIFSIDEAAHAAGVGRPKLQYHISRGNLPQPETWNGRRVYTRESLEVVKVFFANLKPWHRTPQKTASTIN